jgi:hypothetical protein
MVAVGILDILENCDLLRPMRLQSRLRCGFGNIENYYVTN